jgi:hypothetical protein
VLLAFLVLLASLGLLASEGFSRNSPRAMALRARSTSSASSAAFPTALPGRSTVATPPPSPSL